MSDQRIRDVYVAGVSTDVVKQEVEKKPTRTLVCRSCRKRIETESGYDRCPACGAPGSELLQEKRIHD